MKARTLKLLERCIEDGIAYGWQRAYKHDDDPPSEQIQDQIMLAIINEIHEWFEFEQGEFGE